MTLAAWGLILDIVGVLLIAAGTFELGGDKKGYTVMNSLLPGKLVPWAKLVGWLLLLVGFALQFVGEFLRDG